MKKLTTATTNGIGKLQRLTIGLGPAVGDLLVLDVASGARLRAGIEVRFARGTARKSR